MRTVVCVALALLGPVAASETPSETLQRHMAGILTDGDEWRTPNPDYTEGAQAPAEFGLRMELAEDGSHVTGVLHGVFADERTAPYWTMLALYNPVTQRVITQQVGWDGTLIHGDVPVQTGNEQTIDALMFGASGTVGFTRHVQRYAGNTHESQVYERGDGGNWALKQSWTWRRHDVDTDSMHDLGEPPASENHPLVRDAGYLLTGSGRWVADNPDFDDGGDAPKQFGMNYHWGRHGQHIVGEIVSLYADGRQEKDWTLYITHNPITGRSYMEQTGANGVYFRGELELGPDGRHIQSGLVYLPNGTIRSVRDEVEMRGPDTKVSHVFERDAKGDWKKARTWTWRQVAPSE